MLDGLCRRRQTLPSRYPPLLAQVGLAKGSHQGASASSEGVTRSEHKLRPRCHRRTTRLLRRGTLCSGLIFVVVRPRSILALRPRLLLACTGDLTPAILSKVDRSLLDARGDLTL